ncbi:MAG TPA: ParB/RepB/Spo0J family partition protein [Chthonomonadaceae bacterium]|nr:ParB/RepB/Spo0J family partition protein [Chthonomonadaceae bacterium]
MTCSEEPYCGKRSADDGAGGLSLVYVRCSAVVVEPRRRRAVTDAFTGPKSVASLLHPIAITPDRRLIMGERRLAAAIRAGEEYVAAIVVHTPGGHVELLLARVLERGEQPTYSEIADLAEAILPRARAEARRRQARKPPETAEGDSLAEAGTALDRVAALFHISRPTLSKIRAVVAAARHDPARFGDLLDALDAERKVDRVFRELRRRQGAAQPASPHRGADGIEMRFDRKGNVRIRVCAHRADMIDSLQRFLEAHGFGG